MRIKAFDNFSLGKFGSKNKKGDPTGKEENDIEIAEIETNASGKIKAPTKAAATDEKENASEIPIPIDAPPVRPHGPAAELTLEPEDLQEGAELSLDIAGIMPDADDSDDTDMSTAEVKSIEVQAEVSMLPIEGAAPAEEEPQGILPDEGNSLNDLFSQEEEEENPLDSLINSLPDVSVQELMDDLEEIHRIIKEWRNDAKTF